ncbi:MAG: glycine hydroxymethyltransferase [Verrucomicrobiota bacterium]|nr:glycine hydroxymethyltransferase [Verrucomicrobiota bacterium]
MSFLQRYFSKVNERERSSAAIAHLAALDAIHEQDPEIAKSIVQELRDQRSRLKLIASENYSSLSVQLAMGNWMTDKYSEGSVGHRFYAGCGNVDRIEGEGMRLAQKIFGADHAYLQPHSGADANLVAFWSILVQKIENPAVERLGKKNLGELSAAEYEEVRKLLSSQRVMGLGLGSGGHLTHGYRYNISSKMMQSESYEVDERGFIDYAALAKQVREFRPLILIAGYSSYPRRIDFAKMREIADSVGAVLLVDMAHFAGLVAGGVFDGVYHPVPFADIVTTTTHKTLRGPRGGMILCKTPYRAAVDKGCPLVLGGPLPHVLAAKALALKEVDTGSFKQYAAQVVANAQALAEAFLRNGVKLSTGGTDNHLIVIDTASSFHLTGRQAETLLYDAHLTVNRNAIPRDPERPWITSGIRLGTPALTTLGMKEKEMAEIAAIITGLLREAKPGFEEGKPSPSKAEVDGVLLDKMRMRIRELLSHFPLYPELSID